MHHSTRPCVFVTGVTGFLGKVILEELCRQFFHSIEPQIIVLIRPKRNQEPMKRFISEVATSKCFSRLSNDWHTTVQVLEGDATEPLLGIDSTRYSILSSQVTHIIHCAASIDFGISLKEAVQANVRPCMEMLDFARICPNLRKFVSVSTAYSTPATLAPITESLAPLPYAADLLYQDILKDTVDFEALAASSLHPNSYTLSKSIAEHLLDANRGSLPLTIVRPSIISASWRYPFPGWIDSRAALAGFVALAGSGFLHVMEGDSSVIFDVVPVDVVAQHVLQELDLPGSFDYSVPSQLQATAPMRIVHSVSTLTYGCPAQLVISIVMDFFSCNTVFVKPFWKYLGPRDASYHWHSITSQKLPLILSGWLYRLKGDQKMQRNIAHISRSLKKASAVFPQFTQRTYNFTTSVPLDSSFNVVEYLAIVCKGVREHLMLGEGKTKAGPA